jgi:hypothetical protein
MDSGSSKGGGGTSASRPRDSGDACREELFVVTCVVSGDMMGEACTELEVTDEALMAEAGTEVEEEAG